MLPLGLGDDQHPSGYEAALDDWLPGLWAALRQRFPLPPGFVEPPPGDAATELLPKFRVVHLSGEQAAAAAAAAAEAAGHLYASSAHAAAIAAARAFDAVEAAASGLPLAGQQEVDSGSAGAHVTTTTAPEAHGSKTGGRESGSSSYGSQRPLFARLLANRRVTAPTHFQDVRHLEFDLGTPEGGCLTYDPGDVLAIMPQQPQAAVEVLCRQCGLDSGAWVRIEVAPGAAGGGAAAAAGAAGRAGSGGGGPSPAATVQVGPLVAGALDVAGASPRRLLFEVLAQAATTEIERERLVYLSTAEGRDELWAYNQREGEPRCAAPWTCNVINQSINQSNVPLLPRSCCPCCRGMRQAAGMLRFCWSPHHPAAIQASPPAGIAPPAIAPHRPSCCATVCFGWHPPPPTAPAR